MSKIKCFEMIIALLFGNLAHFTMFGVPINAVIIPF